MALILIIYGWDICEISVTFGTHTECPKKKWDSIFALYLGNQVLDFQIVFFPENWDPYINFEHLTISEWFLKAEIYAKQNGILDSTILIKSEIIKFRALILFENDQDKNGYNIYSVILGNLAH